MDNRQETVARNRWLVMNAIRISGVVMVALGMLITQGAIPWPVPIGYVLLVVGLVDVFVVPQLLARKWRSPGE